MPAYPASRPTLSRRLSFLSPSAETDPVTPLSGRFRLVGADWPVRSISLHGICRSTSGADESGELKVSQTSPCGARMPANPTTLLTKGGSEFSGTPLPDDQQQLIADWIANGAKDD